MISPGMLKVFCAAGFECQHEGTTAVRPLAAAARIKDRRVSEGMEREERGGMERWSTGMLEGRRGMTPSFA